MKNSKQIRKYAALLFVPFILLQGCNEEKEEDVVPELCVISSNPIEIDASGGETSIELESNVDWEISSDASWISFESSTEGNNNHGMVSLNIDPNDGDERTGEVVLSAGKQSISIQISQKAKEVLGINLTSPSLLFTAQELDEMKIAVDNASGSLKTAYENLLTRSINGLNYNAIAYSGTDPMEFYKSIVRPAGLVRNLTLAYVLTNDEEYALKAIEIMEVWAKACTGIEYDRDPGTSMLISRGMFSIFCAYDILRNYEVLESGSRNAMLAWFEGLVPEVKEGVSFWEENNYFNHQDFQNHVASHTLGLLSLGVVLQDQSLFKFALDSSENPRDLRELISGSILMEGDTPHHREDPNSPPPEDGEIYDR